MEFFLMITPPIMAFSTCAQTTPVAVITATEWGAHPGKLYSTAGYSEYQAWTV
jgi:hypothetical protein